ncbi:hypothetical protein SCUP234_08351 [Seiridium cupressi]
MEMEFSDSEQVITVLDGAVSTRVIHHPERSFAFHVTLDLVKGRDFFKQKPPLHFHANQDEYIQAVEGTTVLEIEGRQILLSSDDPEYRIPAWTDHRTYPLDSELRENTVSKFLLSGEKTYELFQLNTLFFENWYKYQDEMVSSGRNIDLVQVLSTFDAGGTYIAFPWWVPFGQRVSQIIGIVVGRWIGGLLGYQPFYRKYSTNWDLACREMKSSIFQTRFADGPKKD